MTLFEPLIFVYMNMYLCTTSCLVLNHEPKNKAEYPLNYRNVSEYIIICKQCQ